MSEINGMWSEESARKERDVTDMTLLNAKRYKTGEINVTLTGQFLSFSFFLS
jgi:hypothetical protein